MAQYEATGIDILASLFQIATLNLPLTF